MRYCFVWQPGGSDDLIRNRSNCTATSLVVANTKVKWTLPSSDEEAEDIQENKGRESKSEASSEGDEARRAGWFVAAKVKNGNYGVVVNSRDIGSVVALTNCLICEDDLSGLSQAVWRGPLNGSQIFMTSK